ncbi:MAG: trypsin-like peptidase domain-containing protein [Bdellovibrionaceae bacterium]|nr:trypsin-like peptidase domain-containing protein [Pseudobdellovibrionaceae bacterium]
MAQQSNPQFFQKLIAIVRFATALIGIITTSQLIPAHSVGAELTPDVVFRKYRNAIVRIEVFLGGASLGVGTGFFISKSGELATNLHVVRPHLAHPRSTIEIKTADGRIFKSVSFGACGDSRGIDLCLLKVKYKPSVILPVEDHETTPGESIVTIGHPRGLDFSISKGIVSAVRKHPSGWREIQTDAAISPGNSGGPIINDHGQVIGIVYQYERDGQNLNFGIHSSEAARLLQESVTYRDVAPARTYLSERAGQLDQALITAISNRLSSPLSPQLRWTKTTLGKESIFVLLPALIQNCERMDESDATLASVCQSVGGEWSVTIQRRARSLSKRLALFNGSRLVEPKPLAVIERLETEGRAPASNLDWFQSVPSRANCSALSRHRGFFGAAHSLCHFDTANDTEPGAASASIWIDAGRSFYGVNVWTADPARLPLAREIAKLIVSSADSRADVVQPRTPSSAPPARYSISSPTSLLRTANGLAVLPKENLDTFKDDRQTLFILERPETTEPSRMERDVRELTKKVAEHLGLRVNASELSRWPLDSFEFDGGRNGLWGNLLTRDQKSRQVLLQVSSRYEKDSTFYIVKVSLLDGSQVDRLYDSYRTMLRSFRRIKSPSS